MNVNCVCSGGNSTNFKANIPSKTIDKVVPMLRNEGKLGEFIDVSNMLKRTGTTDTMVIDWNGKLMIVHPDKPTKGILLKGKNAVEQILGITEETIKTAEKDLSEGKGIDLYY